MPPRPKNKDKEEPKTLRPYSAHGVLLSNPNIDREATGICPFCSGPKFSVNVDTSKFQCWRGSCGESGNSSTFLSKFWELCFEQTTKKDYQRLAKQSGFLGIDSSKEFGCAKNILLGNWVVPGFNKDMKITGLYRFVKIKDGNDWQYRLLPTPGTSKHLFNLHNYKLELEIIYLCEGWRDGIAFSEIMKIANKEEANILATPGTSIFHQDWYLFFADKEVNILFDNDEPSKNKRTGRIQEGAGLKGTKRISSILMSSPEPPHTINYLDWLSIDENMKNGMDLRDFLIQ